MRAISDLLAALVSTVDRDPVCDCRQMRQTVWRDKLASKLRKRDEERFILFWVSSIDDQNRKAYIEV